MRADDYPLIRALNLFSAMNEGRFKNLMQAAFLQNFPPQVDLIHEGDSADFLYVIVDGMVELYASAAERETSMAILEPVTTFILAAVISDAPYLMSARTMTKSQILMIPASNVRDVFAQDTDFAKAVVADLAAVFRCMVKAHKNIKLRTAVERLANYLLQEAARQGQSAGLEIPMDKRTLASLLGMTPENLSRAFGTLKPYGVTVDGARIGLRDPDGLKQLAKPNALIDDPEI